MPCSKFKVQSSKFKVFVEGLCKQQLHTFTWMKVKVVNCKTVLVLLEVLGWDGMGLTSGYGSRHCSKDYLMAIAAVD